MQMWLKWMMIRPKFDRKPLIQEMNRCNIGSFFVLGPKFDENALIGKIEVDFMFFLPILDMIDHDLGQNCLKL